MKPAINGPPRSRRALISQALYADIHAGKHAIGSLLPSELELSAAYGASRHTIRAALKELEALGIIEPWHGIGSGVKSDHVVSRFSYSFNSATDLLQYAKSTDVEVLDTTEIAINEEQSRYLRCRPGAHW